MTRIAARILLPLAAAGAFAGLAGGVAEAAETDAGPAAPPIWVVPGLDAGGLLGPTTQAPAQLLAPVFAAITAIA